MVVITTQSLALKMQRIKALRRVKALVAFFFKSLFFKANTTFINLPNEICNFSEFFY